MDCFPETLSDQKKLYRFMPLSSTGPESLEHDSAYISPRLIFGKFFHLVLSEYANQIITQIESL